METQFEICEVMGTPKDTPIEFFLDGKSLGKTLVAQARLASLTIKAAKEIGIDYYDKFVITRPNGEKFDSSSVIVNGKPYSDFDVVKLER